MTLWILNKQLVSQCIRFCHAWLLSRWTATNYPINGKRDRLEWALGVICAGTTVLTKTVNCALTIWQAGGDSCCSSQMTYSGLLNLGKKGFSVLYFRSSCQGKFFIVSKVLAEVGFSWAPSMCGERGPMYICCLWKVSWDNFCCKLNWRNNNIHLTCYNLMISWLLKDVHKMTRLHVYWLCYLHP